MAFFGSLAGLPSAPPVQKHDNDNKLHDVDNDKNEMHEDEEDDDDEDNNVIINNNINKDNKEEYDDLANNKAANDIAGNGANLGTTPLLYRWTARTVQISILPNDLRQQTRWGHTNPPQSNRHGNRSDPYDNRYLGKVN